MQTAKILKRVGTQMVRNYNSDSFLSYEERISGGVTGRGRRMKKNTFILEVYDTQNQSWQGKVEWIQGQKKESFRSVMELLRLIDSVVEEEEKRSFLEDAK